MDRVFRSAKVVCNFRWYGPVEAPDGNTDDEADEERHRHHSGRDHTRVVALTRRAWNSNGHFISSATNGGRLWWSMNGYVSDPVNWYERRYVGGVKNNERRNDWREMSVILIAHGTCLEVIFPRQGRTWKLLPRIHVLYQITYLGLSIWYLGFASKARCSPVVFTTFSLTLLIKINSLGRLRRIRSIRTVWLKKREQRNLTSL